jgi:hypothetical protein
MAMLGNFLGTKEGQPSVDPANLPPREPVDPDELYEGHIF